MIENVNIRTMKPADVEHTVEMIALYNPEHARCALRDFNAYFSAPSGEHNCYIVAEISGGITGCAGYIRDNDEDARDVYWMVYIYVHPDYYRRGLGTRLSMELEARLRKLHARKIYVDVGNAEDQLEAVAFHTKRGYVKEGELVDYFRDGENKLIFGKKLEY